ncbi:hypothetical protein [Streptomyces sp. NPDC101234]|uniref:hypothetical protein n=1 Tax=Streptomyces sp. NPDC101234 TaxID=3366138 RepID=UPI0037FFCC15
MSRPSWSADELAHRLADEERRLDRFRAGDLRIANAFGMSYAQLGPVARQGRRKEYHAAVYARFANNPRSSTPARWGSISRHPDMDERGTALTSGRPAPG